MEKKHATSVKIINAEMGVETSEWKTYIYIYLVICTYIYFTHDTDEEIIDFKIQMSIISYDLILMLFHPC